VVNIRRMLAVAERSDLTGVVEVVFTAEDDEHTSCSRCHAHLFFADARLVGVDWVCVSCEDPPEQG
jgi:hypothetical protein